MTKRALNVYEFIFGAFFILKFSGIALKEWNWFFVFLPLIIGLMHSFIIRIYERTGLKRETDIVLQDIYISWKKNRMLKSEIKKNASKKT